MDFKMVSIEEPEQRLIDSRIKDIERAGERARWIYAAISTLSLILISVAYNSSFSWTRDIASSLSNQAYKSTEWTHRITSNLIKEWVDSVHFDVPLVGAKFGSSDAGIIGGIFLCILSVWCFYAARRENHLIFFMVKDAIDFNYSKAGKAYLRNQLFSTQIFARGSHDRPLGESDLTLKSSDKKPKRRDLLASGILLIMFYLPVVSLFIVLSGDIWSLHLDSPVRSGSVPLIITFVDICEAQFLTGDACTVWHELMVRISGSLLLLLVVLRMMHSAYQFQVQTTTLIERTRDWKPQVLAKVK